MWVNSRQIAPHTCHGTLELEEWFRWCVHLQSSQALQQAADQQGQVRPHCNWPGILDYLCNGVHCQPRHLTHRAAHACMHTWITCITWAVRQPTGMVSTASRATSPTVLPMLACTRGSRGLSDISKEDGVNCQPCHLTHRAAHACMHTWTMRAVRLRLHHTLNQARQSSILCRAATLSSNKRRKFHCSQRRQGAKLSRSRAFVEQQWQRQRHSCRSIGWRAVITVRHTQRQNPQRPSQRQCGRSHLPVSQLNNDSTHQSDIQCDFFCINISTCVHAQIPHDDQCDPFARTVFLIVIGLCAYCNMHMPQLLSISIVGQTNIPN